MKKTLQDQLSEFAHSHGFHIQKAPNQESPQKEHSKKKSKTKSLTHTAQTISNIAANKKSKIKGVIQGIIEQANAGRNTEKHRVNKSVDISAFLKFIIDCKEKGVISEADVYFCLCTVDNIEEFPSNQIKEFQQVLGDSSLRIQALFESDKLSEEDKTAYLKQLNIIKQQQESEKIEHYTTLAKKVLLYGIDVDMKISSTPILDEDDFTLAIDWLDNNYKNKIKNSVNVVLEKFGDDYEIGRVLSARAAEKAAEIFYERCGFKVVDVSIKQLKENGNDAWKYYDLEVDGYPIDVKNSRRSLNSGERYVEHCVPKFKIIRNDINVKISGILSRYLWPKTLLHSEDIPDTSLLFLGETSYAEIEKLRAVFSSEYFDIDFGRPGIGTNYFLPPWIFEYPSSLYKKRNEAIAELANQDAMDYIFSRPQTLNPIPLCIVTNTDLRKYWHDESLSKWEWTLYQTLYDRIQTNGLSLPFVYLSLISHFTEILHRYPEDYEEYRPQKYRNIVFMNEAEFIKPLGVHDPLNTVRSLINVLDKLWTSDHGMIKQYKYFKLSGFHIFQGKKSSTDNWETLVAYCGGWIAGKGKCGKYPLVLGESNRCPVCKKLICPLCGFCSEGCPNSCGTDQDPFSIDVQDHDVNYYKDIPF